MDLAFVIARLKSNTSGMKSIGGAADFETALDSMVAVPSLFVMPLLERANQMPRTSPVYQHVEQLNFAVIVVVSNVKDARGDAGLTALVPVREQVKNALAGWVPDPDSGEQVNYTGGRLLRFAGDQRIWWSDEFELNQYWKRP